MGGGSEAGADGEPLLVRLRQLLTAVCTTGSLISVPRWHLIYSVMSSHEFTRSQE